MRVKNDRTDEDHRDRGLGPFTGWQLTTIICVIAVALLIPLGASAAVKFTNVAITDSNGAHRAKIDATGKLAVGDGAGPLTVDGSVNASNSLPAKPITITDGGVFMNVVDVYGPVTRAFGITSLTLSNKCAVQLGVTIYSRVSGIGDYPVTSPVVAPQGTLELTYPSPLVVSASAGQRISLGASATAINCIHLSGVGIQT